MESVSYRSFGNASRPLRVGLAIEADTLRQTIVSELEAAGMSVTCQLSNARLAIRLMEEEPPDAAIISRNYSASDDQFGEKAIEILRNAALQSSASSTPRC